MPKINGVPKTRPFLDDAMRLNTEGRVAFEEIENRIIITGTGSPENVVTAQTGALYMDTLGTTGSILYAKLQNSVSGDESRGWELV